MASTNETKKRVFIIEDDEYLSRMYERAFLMKGYESVLIRDGAAAIDELTKHPEAPSAILLDVILPKMSGLDVLKKIGKNPALRDIPTAILTNSFHDMNEEQFIALGADAYWVKINYSAKDIVANTEKLISEHKKN